MKRSVAEASGTTTKLGAHGGPRTADELKQTLGLQVDAYIPDTYLETPALKFEIHKHLDACRRLSDIAALALDQADQAAHQAAGAAHREMHAETPLQKGDQAIHRGGGERVAADQQRLEGQHHAQPLVLHVLAGQAVDAAVALQLQQRLLAWHPAGITRE